MLLYSVADLGGSAQNVLIVHCAPSRSTLGSLQGIHQACFSLCRALAPFAAASLFSVTVANGVGVLSCVRVHVVFPSLVRVHVVLPSLLVFCC